MDLNIFVCERKGIKKKEFERQRAEMETGLKVGAVRTQSIKHGKNKREKTHAIIRSRPDTLRNLAVYNTVRSIPVFRLLTALYC